MDLPGISIPSGDGEIRTLDPLLARQVLSQLSYAPICSSSHLLSHIVSNIVPSAAYVLTIVFGMRTGVSRKRIATGILLLICRPASFPDTFPCLHI